ncbi:hypothetical protein O0L34_g4171 [Tuta absoluta]|nr:hypothetical protein O0L34_g4171 [Tuta absoluta]
MKIVSLFGLSAIIFLGVFFNSEFGKKKSNHLKNEVQKYRTLQSSDYGPTFRTKRAANESVAESRLALQDEWKNFTNSSDTEAVTKRRELVAKFKQLWPVEQWGRWGYFSEDYLELINVHWLQFPPPNPALQKTLGGLYLFFSTVGCWGNVIVLFMYFRQVNHFALRRNVDT